MRPFDGKRVLLGVAGGIAAYKAAELARRLIQAGATVQVILTDAGSKFVGATTFEGLTGRPVRRSLWDGALAHIELGRWADTIAVAPATADLLAKLATGQADDLLTTTLLAAPRRAVLAPAMNYRMYEHPATQRNIDTLSGFGHALVGPAFGELAEREEGWGRMAEPDAILAYIGRDLEGAGPWQGRRVVVTAGPTREPLDPVRYLSNRSSGRMGYAVAAAAWRRGAEVVLITGPTELGVPPGIDDVRRVKTGSEMADALAEAVEGAAAVFMVAAVSDYRPGEISDEKIKRSAGLSSIPVEAVPDILATAAGSAPSECIRVAFAVETGADGVESARRKLEDKDAHLVVLNDPTEEGAGFDVETNRVTFVEASKPPEERPLMSKLEVADEILDRAERWLPGD